MGSVNVVIVVEVGRVVVVRVDVSGVSRVIRKSPNRNSLPPGGPSTLDADGPEAPTGVVDTEGENAGVGMLSLGSTESETWLGELMMMTEEGLSWPGGATKLNHWIRASGVGVEEGPASIHPTCMSR